MSFFNTFNISATALTAQRLRMDVISENMANVQTTRTADGGPYRRKTVLFEEITDPGLFGQMFGAAATRNNMPGQGMGVRVSRVVQDQTPGMLVHDPTHPDANEDGYVRMPNINIVEEMVNMISATRSYEANITSMSNFRSIVQRTLEIGAGR